MEVANLLFFRILGLVNHETEVCLPCPVKTATRCPKVIWEQAALPLLLAVSLIAATHNHSTILARWH